ncbi:MAG: thiamine pyrophosphate-dependent enzyme [Bacteroidota bacterium]
MDKLNYLSQLDAGYLDSLYADFLKDPESIDPEWKRFFEGFEFHKNQYPVLPSRNPLLEKEFKLISLINAYRERGHFFTETNPVRKRRNYTPTLDIENFGLSNSDLKTVFNAGSEIGIGPSSLENIIAHLKQTYCRTIGVEYRYIRQPEVSEWLRDKMESTKNTPAFSNEEKKIIYTDISHAVQFEEFLHTRFVGQKRFSLQGVESLIPALHSLVEKGAEEGVSGFIIGMPHRGRLNVLANVLKKPLDTLLSEFEGLEPEDHGLLGDVKYHLGFSTNIQTRKGHSLHLVLSPNPSHLEAVNPVVEGISRALAENFSPSDFKKNIPVLIHGDASIAGQGIVYEVIQMAQLEGYKTGGTIHIVANNQIGFTTDYTDGRSGIYCTDVAKTTQCPIFHVNADDPEAVVFIMQLAIQFRQKFHRDVFIDLLGYRKHGHNEGDEPRYTQPLLYKIIASHPNVKEIYQKKLLDENSITQEDVKNIQSAYIELLRSNQEESKKN